MAKFQLIINRLLDRIEEATKTIRSRIYGFNSDFHTLFFEREKSSIMGENRQRLGVLCAILTVTFIVIGLAMGGLNYLNARMNDPFTNWVDVEKRTFGGKVDMHRYDSIKAYFADKQVEHLNQFSLNRVRGYVVDFPKVIKHDGKADLRKYRTIERDENLLKSVLNNTQGNVVAGLVYDEKKPFAIADSDLNAVIVKESSMIDWGYDPQKQLYLPLLTSDTIPIYLKILSVVHELPANCDMLCFPQLHYVLRSPLDQTSFMEPKKLTNEFCFIAPKKDIDSLKKSAISYLTAGFTDSILDVVVTPSPFILAKGEDYQLCTIHTDSSYEQRYYPLLWTSFAKKIDIATVRPYVNGLKWTTIDSFTRDEDYLAFHFEKLDKVVDFQKFMYDTHKVEISMAQVKSKQNYAFTSGLTSAILFCLIFFSVVSIVSFLVNALTTHLNTIKPNLGTFKAFGLNNDFLINNYIKVTFHFLLSATLISLLLAILIGYFSVIGLLMEYITGDSKSGASFFDLWNFQTAICLILLFTITTDTVRLRVKNILQQTPGNLIYKREMTHDVEKRRNKILMFLKNYKLTIFAFLLIVLGFGINILKSNIGTSSQKQAPLAVAKDPLATPKPKGDGIDSATHADVYKGADSAVIDEAKDDEPAKDSKGNDIETGNLTKTDEEIKRDSLERNMARSKFKGMSCLEIAKRIDSLYIIYAANKDTVSYNRFCKTDLQAGSDLIWNNCKEDKNNQKDEKFQEIIQRIDKNNRALLRLSIKRE